MSVYRWYIVAGAALLLIETLAIITLVVQRARRQQSQARHAAIMHAMPDMMFLLSRGGIYLDYYAPDPSRLLLSPDQFLGKHMRDVVPADVAALFEGHFANLTSSEQPAIIEFGLPVPEGERYYEARIVPSQNDQVVAIVRDVTEQKRSEAVLSETQHELARVSRLVALGEFAASLAHEVRQPLTTILMSARTALRMLGGSAPDLAGVRDSLGDVIEASHRAEEVIRRNHELFRHRTVQATALDINTVILETILLVNARLRDNRVRLATALGTGLPVITGDRIELQQVLLNLIANAIDAMESVEPQQRQIHVSTTRADDRFVQVEVTDSGVGLDGVDLQRMFDSSYTTKAAGSGVGLSISRSIVEAHGGRIWAAPATEAGATFCFTVPAHVSPLVES